MGRCALNMLLVSLSLDRMNALAYMQVCRAIRKGAAASAPFRFNLEDPLSDLG